jgi:CheY-like chemotaxis protein
MSKILLVEDDTNLSEIYQARLEAEGYVVVAATDGETALALAAKEKPDLILSDVMMPKISGFEMLDILRNTEGLKHTKVIMLTALGQAEDRTRAEKLGADRYLVKSQVTLEDIVTAARDLLTQDENALPTSVQASSPVPAAPPAPVESVPVATMPGQPAPTGPLESTSPAMPAAEPAQAADQSQVTAPDSTTSAPTVTTPPADTAIAEPVATPSPETAALAEPVVGGAETTVQEATAVKDQIADFAEQPALPASETQPEPVVVSMPAEDKKNESDSLTFSVPAPEPTPALEPENTDDDTDSVQLPEAASASPANPSAIDESVVANAIDKLLAKSPAPADSPVVVAPDSDSADKKVRKNVIDPLARPDAPSLQELLAKEEAKSANPATPQAPASGQPPATPPTVDPNSIAL